MEKNDKHLSPSSWRMEMLQMLRVLGIRSMEMAASYALVLGGVYAAMLSIYFGFGLFAE